MSKQTETEITQAIMIFKSIPFTFDVSPECTSIFTNESVWIYCDSSIKWMLINPNAIKTNQLGWV